MNDKNKYFDKSDYFQSIILFFIIGVIPLVLHYVQVPLGPDEINVTKSGVFSDDIFTYTKSRLLIWSSTSLLIFHIWRISTKFDINNLKSCLKNPLFIGVFLFIFGITVSTLLSEYRYTSFNGTAEKYESIFILYSYIIIFYSTMYFSKSEYNAKLIYKFILFSALIIGLIGVEQLFFKDIFTTTFGSKLILGKYYNGTNLNGVFSQSYSTLFNPNVLSLYCAMILPLVCIMSIGLPKSKLKFASILAVILLFISLIGSGSSTGVAALMFTSGVYTLILFIYLYKNKSQKIKYFYYCLGILFSILILLLAIPYTQEKIKTYFSNELSSQNIYYPIKSVEVNGNQTTIGINNETITIKYNAPYLYSDDTNYIPENNAIELFDTNNNLVEPTQIIYDNSLLKYTYSLPSIGTVEVYQQKNILQIVVKNTLFSYKINEDLSLTMLDIAGNPIDPTSVAPHYGSGKYAYFGSSRGYIWSRSVPLIYENPLFGTGPDTFALVFPQYEINAKIQYFGNPNILIDKPHNFYLQTAINTGLVSLIGILTIFFCYIVNSIKSILFKKNDSFTFLLKTGVFLSCISFMFSSILIDSSVQTSPIFWALLGLGFSVNSYTEKTN